MTNMSIDLFSLIVMKNYLNEVKRLFFLRSGVKIWKVENNKNIEIQANFYKTRTFADKYIFFSESSIVWETLLSLHTQLADRVKGYLQK